MKQILILRGIPASGKTTYALKWVNEDPNNRVRLNQDDIRTMFGKYWLDDPKALNKREIIVRSTLNTLLSESMFQQFDIVVDNMNLNPTVINYLQGAVNFFNMKFPDKIGYEIKYKDFFIPLEECIKRDAKRPRSLGKKVITSIYNKYKTIIENGGNSEAALQSKTE